MGWRTLGLYQELEFPVNESRWLVGPLQACCYRAEDGNRQVIMEDRMDSVNRLPEFQPSVASGRPT